jgi:Epoxide hydrolase N terminus/HTH-like domain
VAVFIAAQRAAHGIPQAVSCWALGVSQSWFYKWKDGDRSPRHRRRERLKAEIGALFAQRKGKDGSPRITAALRDAGWTVSENTVAALMREMGLAARRVKNRRATTRQGRGRWRAPDLIGRQFPAGELNRKWYGDGTEIVTDEGKLYLDNETEIRSFRVDVPEEAIADLRRRIAATRWPSQELVAGRSQGVQLATLQELARYWAADYDWRRCEAKLNALQQCTTGIDGLDIHFIHVKSRHVDALPLIMTHGWPGSVIELLETVGPLTDPTAHGGSAADAFHLVLPSIPGYGFSAQPTELGW